jgi:hypothetical protein
MNNSVKSISKNYLIILISVVSLLVTSTILIFAEDEQQQNTTFASDIKDPSFFSFFEKITNATESAIVTSPNVSVNVTKSPIINKQNRALSQDIQVLIMADIPELNDNLMDAKESIADGEIEESLTDVTDIENQFILFPNKTTFTGDFQKIKESISQRDLAKALEDITNIQNKVIKAETEIFKAQSSNPELMIGQDEKDNGDGN